MAKRYDIGDVILLSKEKNSKYDRATGRFAIGELTSEELDANGIPGSISGTSKRILDVLLAHNGEKVTYEMLHEKCSIDHGSSSLASLQSFKKNACTSLKNFINEYYGKIDVIRGEGLRITIPPQDDLDSFTGMVRRNAQKLVEECEKANNIRVIDRLLLPTCEMNGNASLYEVLSTKIAAAIMQQTSRIFYIQAGGGCGKTVSLLHSCKEFMENERYISVFIRMKDVFAEADKPLTSYMCSHLANQNDNRVENYNYFLKKLKGFLESANQQIIIFLDGCNEVSEKAISDIEAIIDMPNTSIVMSSRLNCSINGNLNLIKLRPISISRADKYFKNNNIDISNVGKWINNERLRTPFVITKVKDILKDNPSAHNKMTTVTAIMEEWIKRDIEKREFDRELEFGVSVVLPIVALSVFLEMQGDEHSSLKVSKATYTKAIETVKGIFEDWEFSIIIITKFPIEVTAKSINYILGKMVQAGIGYFYVDSDKDNSDTVFTWVHENYRDWFVAKGLQVLGKYSKTLFDAFVKKFVEEKFYYQNSSREKNLAAYTVANFFAEFVDKDGLDVDKEVLVALLRNIVFIADDLDDLNNVREYSDKVESLLQTDEGKDISSLQQAITLSGIACAKLHDNAGNKDQKQTLVDQADEMLHKSKEMILSGIGEAFDKSLVVSINMHECVPNELEKIYRKKVDEVNFSQGNKENLQALDVLSRIYGNLGASYIKKYDMTKNKTYMEEAFMYHAIGGMVKYQIFYYNSQTVGQYESEAMATTYRSLGVDLFRVKEYQKSIDYFEFAKTNFELLSEGFQKGLDLLIVRSKIGGIKDKAIAEPIGDSVDRLLDLVDYFAKKSMIKQIKQCEDECKRLQSLGQSIKYDVKTNDKIKVLEVKIEQAYEQNKIMK